MIPKISSSKAQGQIASSVRFAETTSAQDVDHTTRPKKRTVAKDPSQKTERRQKTTTNLVEGRVTAQALKTRKTPLFKIHEIHDFESQTLDGGKRRVLATEAFNSALKALNDAAKSYHKSRLTTENEKVPTRSKTTPLGTSSPNRQGVVHMERNLPENEHIDVVSTAERAVAALEILRELQSQDEKQETKGSQMLGKGALILVEKLISLGFSKLAQSEMSKIYEQYWKKRKETQTSVDCESPVSGLINPPNLRKPHGEKNLSQSDFELLCSYQSQAMRLAILLGPSIIDDRLIESVGLKSLGSPANLISHAFDVKYLTRDKAGDQLRTCAQALLKLYSVAISDKQIQSEKSSLHFKLLIEALKIKVKSWSLLGHKAELEREYWCIILKGLKRLETDQAVIAQEEADTMTRLVNSASIALEENDFNNKVPKNIISTLIDINEKASCYEEACCMLRDNFEDLVHDSSEQKMLLYWRMATLQHKKNSTRDQKLLQAFTSAAKAAEDTSHSRLHNNELFLLYSARLRKVIHVLVRDISQCSSGVIGEGLDLDLLRHCLQLLSSQSNKLAEVLLTPRIDQTSNVWKSTLTSFAKVFEIIVEFDKYSATAWPSLLVQAGTALGHVIRTSKEVLQLSRTNLQYQEITSFIEGLHVRASHEYWLRYTSDLGGLPISQHELGNLKISCSALEGMRPCVQRSAMYGMKLEKLALAYLAVKDLTSACQYFERVIEYHVAQSGLTEAAEAALSGPRSGVWSRNGTSSYSLSKALLSSARLHLTYNLNSPSTNTWIYDDQKLSPVQRSLLFDAQMTATGDHVFTQEQAEDTQKCFSALMDSLCKPDTQIYKLRFLSAFLQSVSRNISLSNQTTIHRDTYAGLLEIHTSHQGSVHLVNYADSICHLTQIQLIMQQRIVDVPLLRVNVDNLSEYLLGLSSSTVVADVIDDLDVLLNQIQAVIDFARGVDLVDLMLSTLASLKHLLEMSGTNSIPRRLDNLSQLGNLYQRLGKPAQASKVFLAASQLSSQCSQDDINNHRWKLAYTEHLLDLGDTHQATTVFIDSVNTLKAIQFDQHPSGRDRLEKDSLICKAALVASNLAFQSRKPHAACQYARQAVRISTQIWLVIEKSASQGDRMIESDDLSMTNLSHDMTNLSFSHHSLQAASKLNGGPYWKFVDLHLSALHQAILLSVHGGLYQDIRHYAEQLHRISFVTGSSHQLSRASAFLGLIYAKADSQESAVKYLKQSTQLLRLENCLDSQRILLLLAEGWIETGNMTEAVISLDRLESYLLEIDTSIQVKPTGKTGIHKAPIRGRIKPSKAIKAPPKRPGAICCQMDSNAAPQHETKQTESQRFIRNKLEALKTQIYLSQNNVPSSSKLLPSNHHSSNDFAHLAVTRAILMFQQALSELSSDVVKCVLAETAVAVPVRYRSSRKSGRVSFIQSTDLPATIKTVRKGRTMATDSQLAIERRQVSIGEKLVADAQKILRGILGSQESMCATDLVHIAYKLQSKLTLLSSTMNIPFAMSSPELVLQSLMPKDIIQKREHAAIEAERATRDKAQVLEWPDLQALEIQDSIVNTADCSLDDLCEIPESWSIITISLAENQQELLMSKLEGNRSPFILRVPLSRSDLEVDEENRFSFADAKAELLDIITEANTSAHDPRGQGNRDARKAWYAEREELDQRLEDWLLNVESIWLGGFRGLLSDQRFDDGLLVKFGQLLNNILDKHLPSRQKAATQRPDRIVLHAHVVELFLGLGHPDELELDDVATDLLYFVVDILQFSGEHNAYDEIDFDGMLVDLFDAMRVCRDSNQHDQSSSDRHTILIVDKEMGGFPFESLPCLRNQPVSRMPSLSSVFQRLRRIREQSPAAEVFTIPADEGAYILNPSTDLASTQATFEPILKSQLPNFGSIINKIPTESEFIETLTSNHLLLYFGHGSGAQYVRGRSIRNLDNCAVTLLMGCSSAKMTECGKFESYGMPGYYIGGMSGCMAVVGTLWDVTDRDIDRFALKTIVEWGLLEESKDVTKALEKTKKKAGERSKKNGAVKETVNTRQGIVALDEAVSQARDACLLRYLNGAAPVVYGVPVVLQ